MSATISYDGGVAVGCEPGAVVAGRIEVIDGARERERRPVRTAARLAFALEIVLAGAGAAQSISLPRSSRGSADPGLAEQQIKRSPRAIGSARMAMIQARREAGSRCGRSSARPIVATSATNDHGRADDLPVHGRHCRILRRVCLAAEADEPDRAAAEQAAAFPAVAQNIGSRRRGGRRPSRHNARRSAPGSCG